MRLQWKPLLLFLFLFCSVFHGCGDSDKFFKGPGTTQTVTVLVTPTPTPTTDVPSTTVRVSHVLARTVSGDTSSFRFTAFDSEGRVVFGPVLDDKQATIDLVGVPLSAVRMQIEYLRQTTLIGIGSTPMELRAGEIFLISDPFFFDVTSPLVRIDVAPESASIPSGTAQQFSATATFSDGNTENVTSLVVWTSSTTSTATISNDPFSTGRALAASPGTTTIQAELLGIRDSSTLTVSTATLQELTVQATDTLIGQNGMTQFSASARFSDGSVSDVSEQASWSSSDDSVATVSNMLNQRGEVSGISAGEATISAQFQTLTASAPIVVSRAALVGLTVEPPSAISSPGGTRQYRAIGRFSDNSTQDLTTEVTWSTPDPGLGNPVTVAQISNSQTGALAKGEARILGVAGESTTITATLGSLSATSELDVGLFVYSANNASGNISGFLSNPTSGALSAVPGSPFTAAGIQFIVMHPSGRFVYGISGFSVAPSRVIHAYSVDPSDGSLTPITGSPFSFPEPVSGDGGSFSGAVMHPSGRFLYVIDTRGNVDPGYLRLFSLAADGTPTEQGFPGGNLGIQPISVAIRPDGDYLYIIDDNESDLSGFFIDQEFGNATEIPTSAWATSLSTALDMEVDPTGRYVYLIEYGANQIRSYRVAASGILVPVGSPVATGTRPNNVHVHPSGRFVYVSCGNDAGADTLSTYQVNVDGSLSADTSEGGVGNVPRDLVTNPLGNILYVCNEFASSIGTWTVTADGDITLVNDTPAGAVGPYSIVTTP